MNMKLLKAEISRLEAQSELFEEMYPCVVAPTLGENIDEAIYNILARNLHWGNEVNYLNSLNL